jgi:hypothetical protein
MNKQTKLSETQSQAEADSSIAHILRLSKEGDASRPKPSTDQTGDKPFILPGPTYNPDFKIVSEK